MGVHYSPTVGGAQGPGSRDEGPALPRRTQTTESLSVVGVSWKLTVTCLIPGSDHSVLGGGGWEGATSLASQPLCLLQGRH